MKAPPKKNPLGHGRIPGYTLVCRGVHRGQGVIIVKDPVTGKEKEKVVDLWEFLLRRAGGSPSKTLLCAGWDDALSEARKQVAAWEAPEAPAAPRFSQAMAGHLARQRDQGKANAGTMRAEAAWIKLAVEPFFVTELHDPPVAEITEEHVRDWMKKYGRAPSKRGTLTQSTVHHRVRVLRAIFRYAVKKGWRTTNPVEDFAVSPKPVGKPGGDQRKPYPLTAEQMAALQEWLDANAPLSVAFAIRLTAAVGLRDQECTHLRVEDVHLDADADEGRVSVLHFDCACAYCKSNRDGERLTKTEHERPNVVLPWELVAPFDAYLKARAEQMPAASPWAFPIWTAVRSGAKRAGDQLGPGTLNDWLQKAVKAAKIAVDPKRHRLVFHSLRAFAHTRVMGRSKDYEATCVLLGHALAGMGGRYSTLAEDAGELRKALNFGRPPAQREGLAIVA
jgi:integrase